MNSLAKNFLLLPKPKLINCIKAIGVQRFSFWKAVAYGETCKREAIYKLFCIIILTKSRIFSISIFIDTHVLLTTRIM